MCSSDLTDGGATWTAGRTSGTLSTTSATLTVGAATDLWGRSWLPVDLASLRVRVTDLGGSTSLSYYLDAISVTATYQ